jgi:Tfp pilus assembly protein PilF
MSSIIQPEKIPVFLNKYKNALVCLLLLAAVFIAYHQSLDNDFVGFDDDGYIVHNPRIINGLSWENVKWAFSTNYFSNWHPLTWLSFMLDYELYALEPGGYHLTALILHTLNSIILYFALLRLTGPHPRPLTPYPEGEGAGGEAGDVAGGEVWGRCAAVALLFAVHPINVESAAWASERKGVLSTLFWMLALWSYARYAERPSVKKYLPVMAFMSLGLMAKQMLVTLPLVLLLLDYWPLGRFGTGLAWGAKEGEGSPLWGPYRGAWVRLRDWGAPQLVLEKLPLFALSIMAGIATFIAQLKGGSMASIEAFPLEYRLLNSLNAYVLYIKKLILPDDLSCFYPQAYIPFWRAALCFVFLAAVTAAVFFSRRARSRKYLLTGWLWYIITLVPVIGFVQLGLQSMADRYAYIPAVGLFVMAVWGAADLAGGSPGRRFALVCCLSVLILSFTAYTRTQVRYWRNYPTLFSHAAKVTEGNYFAYVYMGNFMFKMGKIDESLVLFSEALRYYPRYADAHYSSGLALLRLARPQEAANHFAAALRLRKNFVEAINGMGAALLELGKPREALAFHKQAVSLKPDDAVSYNGMGLAFLKMGDLVNAEACFRDAFKFAPSAAAYYENLQMVRRAGQKQSRRLAE